MNKLADADGSGIAITADAKRDEIAIGQHRAGGDRGHASVNRVEAVRAVHEVRGTLRRAADAAHLDDTFGRDAHVVHGFDDALGNGVVATTSAERGFAALIVEDAEADAVGLRSGAGVGSAVGVVAILLALHAGQFVGDRARIERQAVEMGDAAQARDQFRLQVELEQAEHLRVAVLLDDVDALVLRDEVVNLTRERIGAQAQIIGLDAVFTRAIGRGFR